MGEGRWILRDPGSRPFMDRNKTQEPLDLVAACGRKRNGFQTRDINPVGKTEVRGGLDQIVVMTVMLVLLTGGGVGRGVGVMMMPRWGM